MWNCSTTMSLQAQKTKREEDNVPNTIFLAGWEARGFRCPDHKVSFERTTGNVYSVSLLQMPNGTGKTTTLQLLRTALSGEAEGRAWQPDQVRAFRKKNGNGNGMGSFKVTLLVDARRVTICLTFDFEEGTVSYTTTLPSGMKQGFRPPAAIEKFFVPEFVNFYVFDGELAEHLLSRDYTDAQSVIENMFQLSLFSETSTVIREYYDRQTAGRSATEERGFTRRQNRVQLLRQRIEMLKAEKAEVTRKHRRAQKELESKQAKFHAELKKQREHGERLNAAQLELSKAESSVKTLAKDLLRRMREPYAVDSSLGAEMMYLKTSLDRVKLPESTAKEFFEELADEKMCVCGRELNDEYREKIRERAKHYLGSDDVAFLNALKSDIATSIGPDISAHEKNLDDNVNNLIAAIRQENECRTVYNSLQSQAVAADPSLQDAHNEIEQLETDCRNLESDGQRYESLDESLGDERTFGIRILERRLEDADRKLAEIAHTIGLRRKRDILLGIMDTALQKARSGISQEICKEANQRIARVMPDNSIRIQQVDRCLVLEGQEGGSAGETLAVAYAFLSTLFNRVDHKLPFIVDSPANPIDLRVRTKIAELIPQLTSQLVAFTISTERQNFVGPLEAAAGESVQFLTLFRRGPADLEREAEAEGSVERTTDGFLVSGKDFFCRFHLEEEEK